MSGRRNQGNSICERCRNYQQEIYELQTRIFALETEKGLHQTLPVTSSGEQPTVISREEGGNSFKLNLSDTVSFPKLGTDQNAKPAQRVIKDNAKIVISPTIKLTNRFSPLSQTDVNIQTDNVLSSQNKNNKVGKRVQAYWESVPNVKVRDTLLLGDGAISGVSHRKILTCCYPTYTVSEITKLLPKVLSTHQGVKQLIVHVGAVDIRMEQSEVLKRDFTKLFEELNKVEVKTFISGPLPNIDLRNRNKFTRLFQLNTWLLNVCAARGLHYIENFDLFWKRKDLFEGNGPHLSRGGVRVLKENLLHDLRHRPGQGPVHPVREKRNGRSIPAAPNREPANESAPLTAPLLPQPQPLPPPPDNNSAASPPPAPPENKSAEPPPPPPENKSAEPPPPENKLAEPPPPPPENKLAEPPPPPPENKSASPPSPPQRISQQHHLPQRMSQLHHHHLPQRHQHTHHLRCPQTSLESPLLHLLHQRTLHSPSPPHLHPWHCPTI
ncbi:hypothetical protein NL108_016189 [Boleophthalmus pectinirostris]|nr:hypothetical protein NL108_016189 [Boleophthalmus pectinirostris]